MTLAAMMLLSSFVFASENGNYPIIVQDIITNDQANQDLIINDQFAVDNYSDQEPWDDILRDYISAEPSNTQRTINWGGNGGTVSPTFWNINAGQRLGSRGTLPIPTNGTCLCRLV